MLKCNEVLSVQFRRKQKSFSGLKQPSQKSPCPNEARIIEAESAWSALCQAFHFVALHPIEWLIIAPDSLLLVLENLKYHVKGRDWTKSGYMGHPIHNFMADYNVLSAGILLSNGTVQHLIKAFPDYNSCHESGKYWNNEDLYLGRYTQFDIE